VGNQSFLEPAIILIYVYSREQGTGNREQGTGNREQGTGNRIKSLLVDCFLGKFWISFKCIPKKA
jgi:hypothetical protein